MVMGGGPSRLVKDHLAIKILDAVPMLISGLLKSESLDLQNDLPRGLHHEFWCHVPTDRLGLIVLPLPHSAV